MKKTNKKRQKNTKQRVKKYKLNNKTRKRKQTGGEKYVKSGIKGSYKHLLRKAKNNNQGPFIEVDGPTRNLGPEPILMYIPMPKKSSKKYHKYIDSIKQELQLQKNFSQKGISPNINNEVKEINQDLFYFTERGTPFHELPTQLDEDFIVQLLDKVESAMRNVLNHGYFNLDIKENNMLLKVNNDKIIEKVLLIDTDPTFFIDISPIRDVDKEYIMVASWILIIFIYGPRYRLNYKIDIEYEQYMNKHENTLQNYTRLTPFQYQQHNMYISRYFKGLFPRHFEYINSEMIYNFLKEFNNYLVNEKKVKFSLEFMYYHYILQPRGFSEKGIDVFYIIVYKFLSPLLSQ